MKQIFIFICVVFLTLNMFSQWKPVGDKIKTGWAETIDLGNISPNYPRPLMERSDWVCTQQAISGKPTVFGERHTIIKRNLPMNMREMPKSVFHYPVINLSDAPGQPGWININEY